jgi:hypothetical protein
MLSLAGTQTLDAPSCPDCGRPTRRLLSAGGGLLGVARLPVGPNSAPASWNGTYRGDREYVAHWSPAPDTRAHLEETPELAARRSPLLAHEGRYEGAPLRRQVRCPTPRGKPNPEVGDDAAEVGLPFTPGGLGGRHPRQLLTTPANFDRQQHQGRPCGRATSAPRRARWCRGRAAALSGRVAGCPAPLALVSAQAVMMPVSGSSTTWAVNPSWRRDVDLCACRDSGTTVLIIRSGATRCAIRQLGGPSGLVGSHQLNVPAGDQRQQPQASAQAPPAAPAHLRPRRRRPLQAPRRRRDQPADELLAGRGVVPGDLRLARLLVVVS